jgi:hypothetical protein
MTNTQLYLAIAVPIIVNTIFNVTLIGFVWAHFDKRMDIAERTLTDLWRSELRRVEEVIDARLKHLEEKP